MAVHCECDSVEFIRLWKSDQQQAPPPEVQVVQVEQKDVPIYSEWVGTLEGFVNAQIRPQAQARLDELLSLVQLYRALGGGWEE
jgi:hypothetical protein